MSSAENARRTSSAAALRLTPFEEYMLVDGRSRYPMSCYIFLLFHGRCEEPVFKNAIAEALDRHPLLRSSVESVRRGVYVWRDTVPSFLFRRLPDGPSDTFFIPVGDHSQGRRFRFVPSFEAGGLDLFREPPLRIHFWTNGHEAAEPETYLFIELHHSASDATGFFRFMEDALIIYANRVEGTNHPIPNYEETLLKKRLTYYRTFSERIKRLSSFFYGLERARTFLLRRVRPLTANDSGTDESDCFSPAFLATSFSSEESFEMRLKVKQRGITLNDFILYALFRGMKDALNDSRFADEISFSKLRGQLRIAVPTNLRNERAAAVSAANMSSMVFLDRTKKKISDQDAFLNRIHREMNHIKKNQLGFAFIHGLAIVKRLLGGFDLMCGGTRCWTTGTFSNLGVLFQRSPLVREKGRIAAGGLELFDVQTAPPIRQRSIFGISAQTYADRLYVGMQYDSKILSAVQSEILFAAIEKYLREAALYTDST